MNTDNIRYMALIEEYVKPEIEVIEIDNEGDIFASSAGGFGDGGGYDGW